MQNSEINQIKHAIKDLEYECEKSAVYESTEDRKEPSKSEKRNGYAMHLYERVEV